MKITLCPHHAKLECEKESKKCSIAVAKAWVRAQVPKKLKAHPQRGGPEPKLKVSIRWEGRLRWAHTLK